LYCPHNLGQSILRRFSRLNHKQLHTPPFQTEEMLLALFNLPIGRSAPFSTVWSPLEKQGALMAFVNYNFSLFNRQSLFFVTLCYDFSAFCAFFDSLRAPLIFRGAQLVDKVSTSCFGMSERVLLSLYQCRKLFVNRFDYRIDKVVKLC